MTSLVLHDDAKIIIERLSARLPHAVLLGGVRGIGLHTIARRIAAAHTKTILELGESEDTIGIDTIRQLYNQLRTKHSEYVVVILDDADTMTLEAQNAFLKLLEEPGDHISFILTSHMPTRLLPTIASRVQQYLLPPPTQDSTKAILAKSDADTIKKGQIGFISQGLPAEMMRLLHDDAYFELTSESMKSAKKFIEETAYGKLLIAYRYGTDRVKAGIFLDALQVLLRHSLVRAPQLKTAQTLAAVVHAHEKLQENGHVRTQLLKIVFD